MKPERVFADTNLFLRYLTNEVPAQADAVEELLPLIASTSPACLASWC